jgi:copper transport protein
VVRFVVGNGALTVTPVGGSSNNHVTGAFYDVARWVSFGGFAALGGLWLLITVWTDGRGNVRARRVVWTGWIAAVVGAAAELLLQGPYTAGQGLSGVAKWTLLDSTLHSDYGRYHCVRLILLGAVALLAALMFEDKRVLGQRIDSALWVPLIAIAYTFSATGHPNTTSPRWLSISDDVLHLCAMATWVGALIMLGVAVLPRASANEAADGVVETVSRVAFVAVCVLAASGTYAAWRGVGTWHAVLTTTYGVLVTTKVALFLGLVGLGYVSRRALRARLGERLRRSVLVEIGVALCVFAATAVLVAQPRGKEALASQHLKAATSAAALGGGRTATVTIDPGTHGNVTITVELSAGAAPQKLTGTATLAAKQLGPLPLTFTKQGPNLYAASGVALPLAGRWDIGLVVTTSEFSATTADVHIRLY